MEKMPYQPDLDRATVTSDWRTALPVMVGTKVTLRELEVSDAPSLFSMLTTEEVSRFISPPPTTAMSWSRKKKPSQVAHQETPWPDSRFSSGRPNSR